MFNSSGTFSLAAIAALSLLSLGATAPVKADSWDVVSGFANAVPNTGGPQNPNGVFSYGSTAILGGSLLTLFTQQSGNAGGNPNIVLLSHGGPQGIYYNTSSTDQTYFTITQPADMLNLHPNSGGQVYTVLRFAAPTAGTYTVTGRFQGLDFVGPTTTDIHVFASGASVFNSSVSGFGASSAQPFTFTVALNQGALIDFIVGNSGNGYQFDSTGLAATITNSPTATPEPATMLLLGIGLAGTAASLRRSTKARQSRPSRAEEMSSAAGKA